VAAEKAFQDRGSKAELWAEFYATFILPQCRDDKAG
jgi:hypothetical protein